MINIRQMEPLDFAKVAELENASWTNKESPFITQSNPESLLENILKGVHYDLALDSETNEICGLIFSQTKYGFAAGQKVLIFSLLVAKERRRQGIARKLLTHLIKQAKERHYQKITLDVLSSNPIAVQFYENFGFHKEAELKKEFFIDNQWIDNLGYAYFL